MSHAAGYPVFLKLEKRHALVVGGGAVGARKATGLLQAGAMVTIVSLAFNPECQALPVRRIAENYTMGHMMLSPWFLVFAATNDAHVNTRIAADAASRRILCNRADLPEESDFSNGASGKIGGGLIAVSTGKASPVLAAKMRDQAIAGVDPLLAKWTELAAIWRDTVMQRIADPVVRREMLLRIAGPDMEKILRNSGLDEAAKTFDEWLTSATARPGETKP